MSASMLLPWVIVTEQGQVLAAHCTCMAGYYLLNNLLVMYNYYMKAWRGMFSHFSCTVMPNPSNQGKRKIW